MIKSDSNGIFIKSYTIFQCLRPKERKDLSHTQLNLKIIKVVNKKGSTSSLA